MSKQTAVEWLIKQLEAPCRGIPSHIIEQSKEMEKQQIKDAYKYGDLDLRSADTYYNETYGGAGETRSLKRKIF